MMKKHRKLLLAAVFFILLMIIIPIIQMLFFTQQTSGRIVVNKPIEAVYLNSVDKQLFLVYFGYVGCEKVCTPILHELSQIYEADSFTSLKPKVRFVFVNLMPEVGPEEPDIFAKLFNPMFQGVYLTQKQLMMIDRQFNVFFSKSLSEPGLIDHSDYVYLMEKRKDGSLILKNIYMTHPLHNDLITDDIRRLTKEIE